MGNRGGRAHILSGKFAEIVRKVSEHVKLDESTKLTFEVSDGLRLMQLYQASYPGLRVDQVHIKLAPRPANCKSAIAGLRKKPEKMLAVAVRSGKDRIDGA